MTEICLTRSQPAHAEGPRTAPTDSTGLEHRAQAWGHLRRAFSCNRSVCYWWKPQMTRSGQSWLFPRAVAAQDPCRLCPWHSPERGRTTLRRCPGAPWPPWWGGWQRPAASWGWAAPRPAGWPGNSGNGTGPSGTAPGSAPTRKSAPAAARDRERRERGLVSALEKAPLTHTLFSYADLTQQTLIPDFPTSPCPPNPPKDANNKRALIRWKTTFSTFVAEVSSWDNCSFDTMLIKRIKISFFIFFVFPGFSAQQSLKRLLSCIKSI